MITVAKREINGFLYRRARKHFKGEEGEVSWLHLQSSLISSFSQRVNSQIRAIVVALSWSAAVSDCVFGFAWSYKKKKKKRRIAQIEVITFLLSLSLNK